MKFLLLGYSSIGARRVLPALVQEGIGRIDIASVSRFHTIQWADGSSGTAFSSYEEALAESKADVVYVSTVNAQHFPLAIQALEAGFHVVVDKPVTLELAEAETLLDAAASRDRLIAEATPYAFHPQFSKAKELFIQAGSEPTQLVSSFSFPRFQDGNYRLSKQQGGGMLLDLGPYAMTPGRYFFGDAPEALDCHVVRDEDDDVESGFSLVVRYPRSRTITGHFGMTTGYINRMDILGPNVTVSLERAFTAPADLALELKVNQHNKRSSVAVPPADSFGLFFRSVLAALDTKQHSGFADKLLADARDMHLLRTSASRVLSA